MMNWFVSHPLAWPVAPPTEPLGDLGWQWSAAIQALEEISLLSWPVESGFLLSGPAPVFVHPQLTPWIFTPLAVHQACLPPTTPHPQPQTPLVIPLNGADPLVSQSFCLLLSPTWNLLLTYDAATGVNFSFDPQDISHGVHQLQLRLQLSAPQLGSQLLAWFDRHPPPVPDYHLVTEFSQAWMRYAVRPSDVNVPTPSVCTAPTPSTSLPATETQPPDVELLQALTHEIRTPFATIQTLIQLLRKRADLPEDVHRRLETIAQECQDQVERFNLIFHAAEVMTSTAPPPVTGLCPVSVDELLRDNIPRWQKQAQRRHLVLEMHYPEKLPAVTSDPNLLDQVLTGLVEHFSQTLPPTSVLRMCFSLAGSQLKIQLQANEKQRSQTLAALGKMLMWQPETGQLSLNLTVTKTLFHALGGKLTVRHDHRCGDILTLYLPVNQEHQAY